MARSTYIYVAMFADSAGTLSIEAACTVKYEMSRWISRTVFPLERLRFFRVRDGSLDLNAVTEMDPGEFL